MGSRDLDKGARLGRYQLLEQIGSGGMAEVFKARVIGKGASGTPLVIKRIRARFARHRAFINMFVTEARIGSLLHHPNIVETHQFGDADGHYYMAMEYVDGADLLKVLTLCAQRGITLQPHHAVSIVRQVCHGLGHAHLARGDDGQSLEIVHRDVSPANILISRAGVAKIMDFGVAHAKMDTGLPPRSEDTRGLKGKLGYMSPEAVLGAVVDHRSDIFALGVVLFEALTLKRLFLGKTDIETMNRVREARVRRRLTRHPDLSEALCDLMCKAMAKSPEDRFQSMEEMGVALDSLRCSDGGIDGTSALREFMAGILSPDSRHGASAGVSDSVESDASATGDSECYFLTREDGNLFGPISRTALSNMIRTRAISPDEPIRINQGAWTQVRFVTNIRSALENLMSDAEDVPAVEGPVTRLKVPEVLYQLTVNKQTGKFKLVDGCRFKEIFFRRGVPVHITSNQREELLGSWLVRRGVISSVQLDRVLDEAPEGGHLGEILVRHGLLGPNQLFEALTEQFRHKVLESYLWGAGWYAFFREKVPPEGTIPMSAGVTGHVVTDVRRLYPMDELRITFTPLYERSIILHGDPTVASRAIQLDNREMRLCADLRHGERLDDALMRLVSGPAEEGHALRLLFVLHQTGHLAFTA